jgi:hypothetical protein
MGMKYERFKGLVFQEGWKVIIWIVGVSFGLYFIEIFVNR